MSLPRLLAIALLAGCAALAAGCENQGDTSIADGTIVIDGGKLTLHVLGAPAASIGEAGELSIDGQPVAVDAAERAMLKRYYLGARAIRDHGIAAGASGTALAGASIKAAFTGATGGDADKQLDAKTRQVTEAAMKICQDLADMKTVQDSLAAQLAAFRPYAKAIGDDDVADCRKHDAG